MHPRVLIVEDDDVIREVYAMKFELEGYPVAVAADGAAALKVAEDFKPDVILLDMMMPVMDGLNFMKRYLNPYNAGPQAEIIVFSNISAPHQMNEVMELGAADYWVKSDYTPEQVVGAVSKRWQRQAFNR